MERALTGLWGRLDPEGQARDADVRAIAVACDAYHQGWFDAVIGAGTRRTGPNGAWPPSLRPWRDVSYGHGRGRAFRSTIGEHLDVFARFRFQATLDMLGHAEQAARAATGDAPQRAADAVVEVLKGAWARADRLGWDDAEWYQYIEVYELTGWTVAALRVPGPSPSQAAEEAERVAEQFPDGLDGWSPWTSKELPAEFLDRVAEAVRTVFASPRPKCGGPSAL
ncbi:hypothetical protein AB0D45_00970 [Streptomyces sp. NPDC048352]|uniref:hypothetical protein n=1 Tax=Streptomyces sp. NPDC048352 TaxID=3154718 RepID=UPI0034498374